MAPNPAPETETKEEPRIQEIDDEEPPELEQVDVDAMKAEKSQTKSQEIWGNDEPAEEEPRIVEIPPNTEPVDLDA